jgi:hypothetical protein
MERSRQPRWYRQLKRDVQTARTFAGNLSTARERLRRFEPFNPAATKRVDDALAEVRDWANRWANELRPRQHEDLTPKKLGAPKLPEHVYEYGAVMVNALTNLGVTSRLAAAEAVAKCLKPLLPKFTSRSLLRWARQRGALALLPTAKKQAVKSPAT